MAQRETSRTRFLSARFTEAQAVAHAKRQKLAFPSPT
jgi:hypothetical protein